MIKELEALKEAKNFRHEKDKNLVIIDIDYFNRCLDGIKGRIEELEETNHSMYLREHENTKKLKALEIIIKKMVNLDDLNDAIYEDNYHQNNEHNAIDIYNQNRFEYKRLTQEEYDLLREVLL